MATGRNIGLDYLRSLAILIVLANHCFFGFFLDSSRIKFEGWVAALSASAVISIEWLFVLSGFLIGTMMIRSFEKQTGWFHRARDFWLRRWFRTIPNYYLFVLINLVLVVLGLAEGKFEFKYLLFSQNLAWVEATPHFFGEAWSLALDEWFYTLMPVMLGLFGLLSNNKKIAFIFTSCLLILAPMIARGFHVPPTEFLQWDAEIRRITIYHLDATGWGVLAAVANKWFSRWWTGHVKIKAGLGVLSMITGLLLVICLLDTIRMNPFLYWISNTFSITLMAGGTFLVMPWLTSCNMSLNGLNWVVEKLSLYSYSIYLVHFPLIFIFKYFIYFDKNTPTSIMFLIVTAWFFMIFYLSSKIFHWFEKPVSDIRERFTKRVDASPF